MAEGFATISAIYLVMIAVLSLRPYNASRRIVHGYDAGYILATIWWIISITIFLGALYLPKWL